MLQILLPWLISSQHAILWREPWSCTQIRASLAPGARVWPLVRPGQGGAKTQTLASHASTETGIFHVFRAFIYTHFFLSVLDNQAVAIGAMIRRAGSIYLLPCKDIWVRCRAISANWFFRWFIMCYLWSIHLIRGSRIDVKFCTYDGYCSLNSSRWLEYLKQYIKFNGRKKRNWLCGSREGLEVRLTVIYISCQNNFRL